MPKYCPVCFGEFKDNVTVCPKDKALLSDKKIVSTDRLIDIYAASDLIEGERIMVLLSNADIKASESRTGISQMPTLGDNRFIIAVQRGHITQAKSLIEQARNDGIISTKGVFI